MRVIFLDVDGVLNSCSFASKMQDEEGVDTFHEDILDDRCLACLKQIVLRTGAEIVLISSWRSIRESRARLVSQLESYGLAIHSDAPRTGGNRGDDICAWFAHHKDVPIEGYVVLDDDADVGVHQMHLVRTSLFDWGLKTEHIRQAVDILMKDERKDERKD